LIRMFYDGWTEGGLTESRSYGHWDIRGLQAVFRWS
jgi:hypothetical protein